MVFRGFALVFILSSTLAYGQLDSNTITVTSSRSASLQADEAVFFVDVSSGAITSLDDVLAALAGSGITQTDFSGVSTTPVISATLACQPKAGPPTPIDWTFNLPVPLSKIKDTVAMLTALQKSISQNNSGLTLSFSVQGTQVSQQLQQMQTCTAADLLPDARAQAQKLASAANLFLGAVLAMSSVTTAPPCTLTVKFAVTR